MNMRAATLTALVLFCLHSALLTAQSADGPSPGRGRELLDEAKSLIFTDLEAADALIGRALAVLDTGEHRNLSDAYNYRANCRYRLEQYPAAYAHLDTAIHHADRSGDSLHLAGLRNILGLVAV